MARLNVNDYRNKVLGCWLGKNVGGTLGAPFEWRRQVNNISFYAQDLHGEPMPNDDLDIQLLWLCAMEEKGIVVTSRMLADYWCTYVTPHWCEYGTAKINMRQGLLPPLSGTFGNIYRHSCGAYIRSEIWACIAPGLPQVAAAYAYEDAILDHGNGEGMYAEVFMAALESAAFLVSDLRKLIDIGLSYIPEDCGVAKAVHTTIECVESGRSWLETRDEVLRRHRGSSPFSMPELTGPSDREKGFHEGVRGYDVPSNIAFTLAPLLYCGDDFGAVECMAVNLGEDTDCTAATAGSVWGIIHGAQAIPQKWIDPIGRGIKTVVLNLGELGYFGNQLPQDVDSLTDRTHRLAEQVLRRHNAMHWCSPEPTDLGDLNPDSLARADHGAYLYGCLNGPRFDFDFFTVCVDYGEAPVIRAGEPKAVRITVQNNYKVQANLSFRWYVPKGWQVAPSADGYGLSFPANLGPPLSLKYELSCERITRAMNRAVFEITIEGRPTVMLVPITLLNGTVASSS